MRFSTLAQGNLFDTTQSKDGQANLRLQSGSLRSNRTERALLLLYRIQFDPFRSGRYSRRFHRPLDQLDSEDHDTLGRVGALCAHHYDPVSVCKLRYDRGRLFKEVGFI